MKLTRVHKLRALTLATSLIAIGACSPQPAQKDQDGENPAATEVTSAQPRSGPAIDSLHLPRDLEIELAKSALPEQLQADATIYVLNPQKGFEIARKGTNGFHAFVARTGDDDFRGTWPLKAYRHDVIYPISFDEVGSKFIMPVFFDAARMQAQGMPSEKLKALIQDRYKSGYYKAPDRGGISYMLSPVLRNHVNPEVTVDIKTTSNPHIMHYAPNISNEAFGGVKPGMHPLTFIIHEGPHGFAIQHLGERERAAIKERYAPMLDRLCKLNSLWCLPSDSPI